MFLFPTCCPNLTIVGHINWQPIYQPTLQTHQRRDEINAGHVVDVVDDDVRTDSLLATGLDAGLEDVGVVKVLHRFRAQVDAELLQLARFAVLEAEHVEDADEAVGGVSHGVVEDGHWFARLARSGGANRWGVVTCNLKTIFNIWLPITLFLWLEFSLSF